MPGPAFKLSRYIVVEGPIRVGKSSLARIPAERLHARRVFDCEDNPSWMIFTTIGPVPLGPG